MAVTCFKMPCHRVFVGCKIYSECFALASEAMTRQFAKATLDAGTGVELTVNETEIAVKKGIICADGEAADLLCSSPNGLSLYQCTSTSLLSFPVSFDRMGSLLAHIRDYYCTAEVRACSVTLALQKTRPLNDGLEFFSLPQERFRRVMLLRGSLGRW